MPKKLGTNTKAVEARARKESAKKAKDELLLKQKEDEYWKDEDKLINRKLDRREEREKKKMEMAERKAQNRAAYEEEQTQIESKTPVKTKVTRSQIDSHLAKLAEQSETPKKELTHLEVSLTENVNRLNIEGDEARNIDEAITILGDKPNASIDRHPERRLKAAFAAFEEINLPRLKNEHPNLRLSQLKQMLKKEWMKSPENPLNQQLLSYNKKA